MFSYSKNRANFEAFNKVISSNIDILFVNSSIYNKYVGMYQHRYVLQYTIMIFLC